MFGPEIGSCLMAHVVPLQATDSYWEATLLRQESATGAKKPFRWFPNGYTCHHLKRSGGANCVRGTCVSLVNMTV